VTYPTLAKHTQKCGLGFGAILLADVVPHSKIAVHVFVETSFDQIVDDLRLGAFDVHPEDHGGLARLDPTFVQEAGQPHGRYFDDLLTLGRKQAVTKA
jgi:hypothetical protein